MPPDMGKLKDLQFLSDFVLDKDTGKMIVELKELQHLHNRLCISGLDNIVCERDALEANISGMEYLAGLELKWEGNTEGSEKVNEVLGLLQPHADIKEVRIESYGGTSFPNWVGDHSFSKLTSVALVDCKFCLLLPPLGQLPSLVTLHLESVKVESVGLEFYGRGVKPFRSLEKLSFVDMLEWQKWSDDVGGHQVAEGGILPNLCILTLKRCPKLTKMLPLDKFPNLKSLHLSNLNSFTSCSLLQESKLISLSGLRIDGCPKLKIMRIERCKKFRLLPEAMRTLLPSLKYLTISRCPEFESFPQGGLPPGLTCLSYDCSNNKIFANRTQWGLQKLNSLSMLTITDGVFSVFPEEVLLPTSLTDLRIYDCPNLTTLDGKGLRNLDSLRCLVIGRCPELQCLPEEGLPTSVSELRIYDCPSLGRRLQRERGEDWPKIARIPNISIDGKKI